MSFPQPFRTFQPPGQKPHESFGLTLLCGELVQVSGQWVNAISSEVGGWKYVPKSCFLQQSLLFVEATLWEL